MLTSQLVTGLLLGFDSFLVCLAVGALPQRAVRRSQLALAFGLCDGFAAWAGSVVGMQWLRSTSASSEWLGPAAVAAYGVYILYLALRSGDLAANPGAARWLAFGLPVCLSLDNLVAGVATPASAVPAILPALAFGVMSGGLALVGSRVGSAVRARSRFRVRWLGGALLVLFAAGLVLKDALLDLNAHI
jgi:putative Mn2+ efflux pump MntP